MNSYKFAKLHIFREFFVLKRIKHPRMRVFYYLSGLRIEIPTPYLGNKVPDKGLVSLVGGKLIFKYLLKFNQFNSNLQKNPTQSYNILRAPNLGLRT